MDILKTLVNEVDWAWFATNPANVTGLVLALGGILLNLNTDAKGTKILGGLMLLVAVVIIAGKLMYENGIVPIA